MTRSALVLVAIGAVATVDLGCGGRAPFPPVDPRYEIFCEAPVTFCNGGIDMTGMCLDPVPLDLTAQACATRCDRAGCDTPEVQGVRACERLLSERCAQCQRQENCRRCTAADGPDCEDTDFCPPVAFVGWGGPARDCTADWVRFVPGGVTPPRPSECPDAGPAEDASSDPDAGDASLDAGPMCMEPEPGPDPMMPPPGTYVIDTYLYEHPALGARFRRIELPADLSPPAAIAPDGLLWAISETGRLVGWNIAPTTPDIVIDLELAEAIGPSATLHVTSFGLYLPPAGDPPEPLPPPAPAPPAIPTDPPVDYVLALVGAEEGLYLFEVRIGLARLVVNEDRMNVEEAALNGHPVLEADFYTVFSTAMLGGGGTLFRTSCLGGPCPVSSTSFTTGDIAGFQVEPLDLAQIWSGLELDGTDRLDRFIGADFRRSTTGGTTIDQPPDEIVGLAGPEEWYEFSVGPGDPPEVTFAGVVNDALLVASTTDTNWLVRSFIAGNLNARRPGCIGSDDVCRVELSDEGVAIALAAARIGDELFGYLATQEATSRFWVLHPTASAITIETGAAQPLATGFQVVDMAIALPDCDPGSPAACTPFAHFVGYFP